MIFRTVAVLCVIASVALAAPQNVRTNRQASSLDAFSSASPSSSSAAADAAAKAAAQQAKLHYVEIGPSLKGDYKFGYDTGSGPAGQSFREETRLDDGTVKGAYGYVDANGKQRIVKYTAGKNGFVVENDAEAPNQGAAAAPAAETPAPRPQPVARPQSQQFSQPQFDEPLTRSTGQPQNTELLHAQQVRQHQLAHQQALAEQQRIAQQQQREEQALLAQQQLAAQQAAAARARSNQQQFGFQPQQQPQQVSQVVDPRTGHFFASSTDGPAINQLLAQQQLARGFPQQQSASNQFQAQPDVSHQLRARQLALQQQSQQQQQQQQQHQAGQNPSEILGSLHQSSAHAARILENLRAQQAAQAQAQSQAQFSPQPQQFAAQPAQQPQPQQFSQPQQASGLQFGQAESQQAPVQRAPARLSSSPGVSAAAPVEPEQSFGPPVIDIRTLNYSIGQQTRVGQ